MNQQADEQLTPADFVGAEIENGPLKVSKAVKVCGKLDLTRERSNCQETVGYLEGLKGLIAFEAFLWVFFRTIIPGSLLESITEDSTLRYVTVIREIFGPLFWDGNLQASFFVILSARVISIRFLQAKSPISMAGTLFRRGIRLCIPTFVALLIATIVNHHGSNKIQ